MLFRSVRTVKPLLLVAGLALLAFLVYRIGVEPIAEALRRLAWWQFALICVPYAFTTAADTLAWRYAFPRESAPFWRLYGARMAGEALNLVTAVGQVGGEAVKAWLVRRDVSYEESIPSVIVAKTTITIAQALFLALGIALALTTSAVDSGIVTGMLWLLLVEVLAVGGFLGAQVSGVIARGGRVLRVFGIGKDSAYAQLLDDALRSYYRNERRRFGLSVGFHLLGWVLGAAEAVLVLWALGIEMGPVMATVIEAFGSGVRFASFMVPASLGAFEGANAAAFEALGLGAGAGLAFSLVRRARQVVWIVAGIVVMVVMRWSARRAAARTAAA